MIVAVLQARTGSTRLPGKVLADLHGRPMIIRQLERLQPAAVDAIVVATTTDPSDDALARLLEDAQIPVFRGATDDVLDRIYRAAQHHDADIVVRLTADCPLADHRVVDRILDAHSEANADYTSNTLTRTYPDGLDVEVVSMSALERAWTDARATPEREHVTPYIYAHPEVFRLANVTHDRDLSRYRVTVDFDADLAVAREIFAALYPADPLFSLADIIGLLEQRPELVAMNAAHNAMLDGANTVTA